MNTSQSKLSLESLRAVTLKLLNTCDKLARLVHMEECLSFSSTSSVRRMRTTSAFSELEISGNYTTLRDIVVYVSGPITASKPYRRWDHIQRAREIAEKLWVAGFTVLCPQLNTMFMDGLPNMGHSEWLAGDLNLIERAVDVCYFIDGWTNSSGCKIEHDYCERHNIAIFYEKDGIQHMADWLKENVVNERA